MKDLSSKTCKELREVAKGLNIKGRWDMNKQELIEAIESTQKVQDDNDLTDVDITFESNCIYKEEEKVKTEGPQKALKTTYEYLNSIQKGTMVAFKRSKNKDIAMSGKFVCFENGRVIVESKRGTRYTLVPDSVIWVKTGTRWPKWVYSLFNKGQEVVSDNAFS